MKRELKIGGAFALEGTTEHKLHRLPVFGTDEFANQVVTHHLFLPEASYGSGLLVPLIYFAINVNSKDWGVGSLNEDTEVFCHPHQLDLCGFLVGDVLADTDHTHQVPGRVHTGGGVQEDLYRPPLLVVQRELEIRCALALQGLLQDTLHRDLVLAADELRHQIMPHHFLTPIACDVGRLQVPLVHAPLHVDPEDGGIGGVDQFLQVFCKGLQLLLSLLPLRDILSHAHHADGVPVGIPPCGRIQQDIHALTILRVQRELKVARLLTVQRILKD
mmetsp:Transcript_42786/g.76845  ORF Transcript_42786/g.76845 Transcript_42786/m.76845 type:complete len:274 (+) Transcript_42786:3362-4183(+)